MRAANADRSPRLRRVLAALRKAGVAGLSTRELMWGADVCAVSACVSELRAAGHRIECHQELHKGRRRWRYVLVGDAPPPPAREAARAAVAADVAAFKAAGRRVARAPAGASGPAARPAE